MYLKRESDSQIKKERKKDENSNDIFFTRPNELIILPLLLQQRNSQSNRSYLILH